jgi:hypothetical protein
LAIVLILRGFSSTETHVWRLVLGNQLFTGGARAARSPECQREPGPGLMRATAAMVFAEKRITHGIPPAEQLLMRRINSADNATLITMEPRQPNRFEKKTNIQRSPLSPCPRLALAFAFLRRSVASDRPTSSDSLSLPPLPRRTNRLSTPVSITSRRAALFLPALFVARFLAIEDCLRSLLCK